MRREIEEIPAAAEELMGGIGLQAKRAALAFRDRAPAWLTIVARGTSDHAAVYARYMAETTLGLPSGLSAPSVITTYGGHIRWGGGALLAISQSGESPDVVEVTRAAREGGAVTVAITNRDRAPLAEVAQHVILCRAGEEHAVPATKTYVTQLMAVAALVATIANDHSALDRLAAMPALLSVALSESYAWLAGMAGAHDLAGALVASDRALVVSRGYNLATALEVALKLKETSAMFAEPYSAADLLHGPLALAAKDVPMLVFQPSGPISMSVAAAVEASRERGAQPWLIGAVAPGARNLPLALELPERLTPIPYVMPGYVLAEEVAQRRGLNPDAPLGLQKITHTR